LSKFRFSQPPTSVGGEIFFLRLFDGFPTFTNDDRAASKGMQLGLPTTIQAKR
jgi:hypothetical protein